MSVLEILFVPVLEANVICAFVLLSQSVEFPAERTLLVASPHLVEYFERTVMGVDNLTMNSGSVKELPRLLLAAVQFLPQMFYKLVLLE